MTLTPEQERDCVRIDATNGNVELVLKHYDSLRSELEQRTLERDVLGDELKRVQDERYKYRSELEAARADVETAAAAADEWKRKALSNPLRSDLEAARRELGEKMDQAAVHYGDVIRSLESDLEAAREGKSEITRLLLNVELERDAAQAEVERLRAEETYMAHHLREATEDVERLRAALESYRKKLADKDRVLYDSEHDELREQVERLRGENSTLRSLLPDGVDVAGFEY